MSFSRMSNDPCDNIRAWIEACPANFVSPDSSGGHKRLKRNRDPEMADETPVPKRRAVDVVLFSPSATVLSRSDTANTKSTDATRSRSSSPSKRKRDLEFVKPKIVFQGYQYLRLQRASLGQIPLFNDLLSLITQAQSALPQGLEEFISARTEGALPLSTGLVFTDAPHLQPFSDLQRDIVSLQGEILHCETLEVTEEEWSDRVVYPILRTALQRTQGEIRTDIATVKSIGVSPGSLLPANYQGERTQKKRVDYTLGVALPDKQKARAILASLPGRSFSQSTHPRLADLALFSHLEIKQGSNAAKEGEIQLGIWSAAGFKKMEELWRETWYSTEPMPKLSVVPLWLWQNKTVTLLVATYDSPDTINIVELTQWILDRDDQLIKFIITLTFVMEWGTTHFLNWFKTIVGYSDEDDNGSPNR